MQVDQLALGSAQFQFQSSEGLQPTSAFPSVLQLAHPHQSLMSFTPVQYTLQNLSQQSSGTVLPLSSNIAPNSLSATVAQPTLGTLASAASQHHMSLLSPERTQVGTSLMPTSGSLPSISTLAVSLQGKQ